MTIWNFLYIIIGKGSWNILRGGYSMTLYEAYKSLNDREQAIKIRVNEDTQLITVSYLHSGVDFSNSLYRRARGLTFNRQGDIILRGFEKFFNYMELETYDTYTEDFKDEFSRLQQTDEPLLVQEKLDGTMVLIGLYQGSLIIGTTSSTDNEAVKSIQDYLNRETLIQSKLRRYLREQTEPKTLVFEFTAPYNQIVVEYGEEALTLLAQVDNLTGEVTDFKETERIAKQLYWVKAADSMYYTLDELLHIQKTAKGIEGFVVINNYGRRVKIKTDDWFEQKGKLGVFFGNTLNKRVILTILNWYRDGELDDYLSYQNQHGVYKYSDLIGKVMNPLYELWNEVQLTVEKLALAKGIHTRKDMVVWLNKHATPVVRNHILSQKEVADVKSFKGNDSFYIQYIQDYYK